MGEVRELELRTEGKVVVGGEPTRQGTPNPGLLSTGRAQEGLHAFAAMGAVVVVVAVAVAKSVRETPEILKAGV